jgi:hypothetical protein
MAGATAHPEVGSACTLGGTCRPDRRGGERGRQPIRLARAGDSVRVGAASGVTACTSSCRWGRGAVMTWRRVIGLFEFKFDRLNRNLTV